jgi:hypothetical protein
MLEKIANALKIGAYSGAAVYLAGSFFWSPPLWLRIASFFAVTLVGAAIGVAVVLMRR